MGFLGERLCSWAWRGAYGVLQGNHTLVCEGYKLNTHCERKLRFREFTIRLVQHDDGTTDHSRKQWGQPLLWL